MRDPARIEGMLAKLGEVWRKSPDLRLGQLVYHLGSVAREMRGYQAEVFHVEDGDMLNAIERELERSR